MELKRDDIIKALECCTYGGDKTKSQVEVCSLCPCFNEGNCTDVLKESTLTIIKELTEENERLKAQKYMAYPDGRIEMIPTVESVKADTVRKMQERLHERFGTDSNRVYSNYNIHRYIDQIAKEMLEGV